MENARLRLDLAPINLVGEGAAGRAKPTWAATSRNGVTRNYLNSVAQRGIDRD